MSSQQYSNPVTGQACPDPFVLKINGIYWAYCTGIQSDGGCFGILSSPDLIHWEKIGSAMQPITGDHTCYWAPEVDYHLGKFYLYYSVGNETIMHIRVAVADHPEGLFKDMGAELTSQKFAIDPHVFCDEDGKKYLFYATDFLEHPRIGTGTVYEHMLNPTTLDGKPHVVSRARYDWQIFDPARSEKKNVCWHTLEGPFVLYHKQNYYQMFSAGNWQNKSYGVGYAITSNIDSPTEWHQPIDGIKNLPVLFSIPSVIYRPGHNSVIRGPNNRQKYCIYHCSDHHLSDRVMAVNRLDWIGNELTVPGFSTLTQAVPLSPTFSGFTPRKGTQPGWESRDYRHPSNNYSSLVSNPEGKSRALFDVGLPYFLAEMTFRIEDAKDKANIKIRLLKNNERIYSIIYQPSIQKVYLEHANKRYTQNITTTIPLDALSLIRIDCDYRQIKIRWQDLNLNWESVLEEAPESIEISSLDMMVLWTCFELTAGWEDTFDTQTGLEDLGWQSNSKGWLVNNLNLQQTDLNDQHTVLSKGPACSSYEWLINARLLSGETYGFVPIYTGNKSDPTISLHSRTSGCELILYQSGLSRSVLMPEGFEPHKFHQFRLIRRDQFIDIYLANQFLITWEIGEGIGRVGLFTEATTAEFDTIKFTPTSLTQLH